MNSSIKRLRVCRALFGAGVLLIQMMAFVNCSGVDFASMEDPARMMNPDSDNGFDPSGDIGDGAPPPAEPGSGGPAGGDLAWPGEEEARPVRLPGTFLCSDTWTRINRGATLSTFREAVIVVRWHEYTRDPAVNFDPAPEICRSGNVLDRLHRRELPIPGECEFDRPGRYSIHIIDPTVSQTPNHHNDLVTHVGGGGGLQWYDNAITVTPRGTFIHGEVRILLDVSLSTSSQCDVWTAPWD